MSFPPKDLLLKMAELEDSCRSVAVGCFLCFTSEIPMRELTSHKLNGLNDSLRIVVHDEPGQGNACHKYSIHDYVAGGNGPCQVNCYINFQDGPILESGVNGISNEALLAIVEDRLLGFQSGEYSCRENAIALTHIQEAMMWLQKRTRDRMARGVEGTNAK